MLISIFIFGSTYYHIFLFLTGHFFAFLFLTRKLIISCFNSCSLFSNYGIFRGYYYIILFIVVLFLSAFIITSYLKAGFSKSYRKLHYIARTGLCRHWMLFLSPNRHFYCRCWYSQCLHRGRNVCHPLAAQGCHWERFHWCC